MNETLNSSNLSELLEMVDANLAQAAAIVDCVRVISESSIQLACREHSVSLALHHALEIINKSKVDLSVIAKQ